MINKLMPFVLAGIFGGLVTVMGTQLLNQNTKTVNFSPKMEQLAKQVNYAPSNRPATALVDFRAAAKKTMPAVVHIKASESNTLAQQRTQGNPQSFDWFFGDQMGPRGGKSGSGSGVIYTDDGYIVTNNHVVDFADQITVTLYDNREYAATIVGRDKKTDLAVLKIEADGLPTLELGNSEEAEVGEWVLAVGNPFDLTSTVTAGIISAKGRNMRIIDQGSRDAIEAFIQTDAAVNPGNSGGALVNEFGQLIGINTAIATKTGSFSGYSFAIPVNMMTKIVNDIMEFGEYQRGYLGINISDLDNQRAQELGLNITQGVVVETLADGGAAQFAGVEPLDIIVSINGDDINSSPQLLEKVGTLNIGDTVNLTVNRRGKLKDFPIRLKGMN